MEGVAAIAQQVAPALYNPIPHYRQAFFSPLSIVEAVQKVVAKSGVNVDTFAVSGISGLVMGPLLSTGLNKYLVVVPQDGGEMHHRSSRRPVGLIQHRWMFVDDFINSGRTHRLVQDSIEDYAPSAVQVGTLQYHLATYLDGGGGRLQYYVQLADMNGQTWTQNYGTPEEW